MLKYIKAAFWNPWNLLCLAGGLAFSALTGQPEVGAALVVAGETAYLGFVGTHPRFQKYVDVMEHQEQQEVASQQSEKTLKKIYRSLPDKTLRRFSLLREQCRELREIAADLKQQEGSHTDSALDTMQIEGLDRLLWVFLRLLFTQHSIERFLSKTSLDRMQQKSDKLRNQLADFEGSEMTPHREKLKRTLEDNLKTTEDRINNYRQAEQNLHYVELELDRLESKIKSLAELAINRREPEFISDQIDQVSRSMMETEKTMNDLQHITGLDDADMEAPQLLRAPVQVGGRQ